MDPRERKRQILDCAAEVFAAHGVASTTVRQIADAVGVYSGTLYHYFPSKETIVYEVIREYLLDLRVRFREALAGRDDPITRLEILVRTAVLAAESYPHATRIWQNELDYMQEQMLEADLGPVAAELEGFWTDTITAGVAAGQFRADIDPHVFHMLLRNAVWMASQWYRPSDDYPADTLARDVVTVFVDGFRAPPA
ncbi:TetR/AcrR family transcriptional regulator [Rhodococcus sp. D2-41]|uniref:TetR/AcrR family transcriptional regulator n=1 Tax=Speluncibacter jeojiensis TaxID=2710754 RepID=A0A9X4M4C9_9ACTN|nr:TetR/AcrR family transcriptional regulator [Rhodococcus sp. D2-41]MDG3011627.1 TetR/AcrR family transcriptional regulator [Rhodococcus sp. D2-41]MDG3015018.1 TetR/AcrR family transcriptional regulator [Corynebacteriales bacterium D3-21]